MAKKREIEVVIGKDGDVKIEVSGFDDGGCLKETEEMERKLGTVTNRTKKAEAYHKPENKIKQGN